MPARKVRQRVRKLLRPLRPLKKPATRVLKPMRWGDLRRAEPKSRGFSRRGVPVDRFYIEAFLRGHASDIRGTTLEVASDSYVRRFGGRAVQRSEVVSIEEAPGVTIVGDLTDARTLPAQTFDCIVFTQTLQFIYDVHAALRTLVASLKPGGVLLMTVPGISQISGYDEKLTGDYWRFTCRSVERLLSEHFAADAVDVRSYGNVLAAVAFLHNVARQELKPAELKTYDPQYPLIIAARAVKR